jgi:hypothetical protein
MILDAVALSLFALLRCSPAYVEPKGLHISALLSFPLLFTFHSPLFHSTALHLHLEQNLPDTKITTMDALKSVFKGQTAVSLNTPSKCESPQVLDPVNGETVYLNKATIFLVSLSSLLLFVVYLFFAVCLLFVVLSCLVFHFSLLFLLLFIFASVALAFCFSLLEIPYRLLTPTF